MALICSFERFLLSGLWSFSSCMNFSQREMYSRSGSSGLGLDTGIYFHQKPPLDVTDAVASKDPMPIVPKVKL